MHGQAFWLYRVIATRFGSCCQLAIDCCARRGVDTLGIAETSRVVSCEPGQNTRLPRGDWLDLGDDRATRRGGRQLGRHHAPVQPALLSQELVKCTDWYRRGRRQDQPRRHTREAWN